MSTLQNVCSFVEHPMPPMERDPSRRHGVSSFFDWHHASRKQDVDSHASASIAEDAAPDAAAQAPQPTSPVHRLVQQMSLEADSSSDESGGAS